MNVRAGRQEDVGPETGQVVPVRPAPLPPVPLQHATVLVAGLALLAASLPSYTLGSIYPAYMTVRSLQAGQEKGRTDRERWLQFWTVLACLHLLLAITDPLLSWSPAYWLAKGSCSNYDSLL